VPLKERFLARFVTRFVLRLAISCALLTSALLASRTSFAAGEAAALGSSSPKPRVVVIAPASVPPPFTTDILVSEIVDEMRTSGVVDPVSPRLLTAAQKTCQDDACLAALAAATGAAYVVRFDAVAKADDDYMFQATAWRASSRTPAGHASAECGLCLGEKIRGFARNVAGQIEMAIANDAAVKLTAAAPVTEPSPSAGGVSPLLSTATSERHRWHKAVPWATGAVGVALATGGVVLLAKDGEDSCSSGPCRNVYDTRGLGVALLGAGILTVGIGAVLLYELQGDSVTVALGPGSCGVAGRF